MNSILIHAWAVKKFENTYYIPYTHFVYLKEVIKYYNTISLLSPTEVCSNPPEGVISLKEYNEVSIIELPHITSYIGAIKNFLYYFQAYKRNHKNFHVVYARYPVPFGWLQKIYMKKARRIIHFVGDPVDAANTNPNFSKLKKRVLITFFKPEHKLYTWACEGAEVYTNGFHIAARLKKKKIKPTPLISSTLNEKDFYFDYNKKLNQQAPRILYVGYLRRAKGVETVLRSFNLLKREYPLAKLTIVGTGEFERDLRSMVTSENIPDVSFLGHIDHREELNLQLRMHDIFCFASLSEGSPRVILEAMANGLNVITTPVGALPHIFKDNKHLVFSNFNDPKMFCTKMAELIEDEQKSRMLRANAYKECQKHTIEKFIKTIFNEA